MPAILIVIIILCTLVSAAKKNQKAAKSNRKVRPLIKPLMIEKAKHPKIILDSEFVAEYIRGQNATEDESTIQEIIDVEEIDSSVEFVCETRKIVQLNQRLLKVESLLNAEKEKKANAAKVSDSVINVSDINVSLNNTSNDNTMGDFDTSINDDVVNQFVDEYAANGQLPELTTEIAQFCEQQQ